MRSVRACLAGALLVSACASSSPLPSTIEREAPLPEGIAAAFEPAFVAEFGDASAARTAWRTCGAPLLDAVEGDVYPPVPADVFNARAVARIRAYRAAWPDATPESLSHAALDGLLAPEEIGDAATIAIISGGPTVGELMGESSTLAGFAAVTELTPLLEQGVIGAWPPLDGPGIVQGSVAGVPSIALPTDLNPVELDPAGPRSPAAEIAAATPASGPLVLDLRGNQGGEINSLLEVAGVFAPADAVLFRVQAAGVDNDVQPMAAHPRQGTGPLLVVVDEETQSGALLLAAALADAGVARVAGTAADRPRVRMEGVKVWWWDCVGRPPSQLRLVRYPSAVVTRANGAPLADGVPIDYPVDANDPAALEAVVVRWLADVGER
jgi:hypothetical protein